jgi:hypothetical protein
MCFILNDLKYYGNITSSSRIHLWSVKEKKEWKNKKKRNKFSNLQNTFLSFFYSSLDLFYFQTS